MPKKEKRDTTLAGIFWSFGERILAQVVSLTVSIILARILLPSEYGVVSLVMIFITIANVFVSHGLGDSLIQKKDADIRDFSTIFYCNTIVSVLIYFILFVIAPTVSRFYNEALLTPVIRVLGIRIPIAAINSIQHAYVSKHMQFKKFFFSTLGGTVVSGVVGIWMAYKGYGAWALVAQYLTNTTIDTIVLFITVKWRPTVAFSRESAKELIGFGWKATLAALINSVYTSLRSLVIGKVYSSADLAYYNKGNTYPSLIITNINTSISRVTYPALSNSKGDDTRYLQLLRRTVHICAYAVLPCLVLLMVIAKPFISFLLTDKWLPAVPFLQILCVYWMAQPLLTNYANTLKSLGRSDLQLKLEIGTKVVGITLIAISMWISTYALAISAVITAIASVFMSMFTIKKIVDYPPKYQVMDFGMPLLIAFLVGTGTYFICYFPLPSLLLIVVQGMVFLSAYLLITRSMKMEGYYYLAENVKKIMMKLKKGGSPND